VPVATRRNTNRQEPVFLAVAVPGTSVLVADRLSGAGIVDAMTAWQRALACVALLAPPLGLVRILGLRSREAGVVVPLGHWALAVSATLAFWFYWGIFGHTSLGALWALVAVIGSHMGYAVVCESIARSTTHTGTATILVWSLAFFMSVASSQVSSALQSSFPGGLDFRACSPNYVSLAWLTLFVFVVLGFSGADVYRRKDLFFREMWDEMDSVRPPVDTAGTVDKVYLYLGIAIVCVVVQPFLFMAESFNALGFYKCFQP